LTEAGSTNPFVRYRWLLDSYRKAMAAGSNDADFVSLVRRLDEAVAGVAGQGFAVTPLTIERALGMAVGVPGRLWVKDETGNVGGSHKARHLFGVLLHLAIDGSPSASQGELAIASCGNAALAAALVARADQRALRVFIPTWADPLVVAELQRLGATIEVCERRPDEPGDPSYLRFQEAIGTGMVPFSVQGPATPTAIDGGRTLGWELAEQLAVARGRPGRLLHLIVQVGGGALATAVWQGIQGGIAEQWLDLTPVLHTVQTEAVAPLNRAWRLLLAQLEPALTGEEHEELLDEVLGGAARHPDRYMWAWEHPGASAATGILDDVTYDWLPVAEAMLRSGGTAHVVSEAAIERAHELATRHTASPVDHTGSAGLAALLNGLTRLEPDDEVAVLFTGVARG
jgi:threonine synthase